MGLRNDVSKLSERQQRLENEFKTLRVEQQVMKLSLMEISQSNREVSKSPLGDDEKRHEMVNRNEVQKKETPDTENLTKQIERDASESQKVDRTVSSCANFLPIDGVDSDMFSTAKG